jgi:anti-sigma regulatory factor (Ser/Thr protein kinase)
MEERLMNEDALNMSVRKFLKQVGITAQREIETAVREAISNGSLSGKETLPARATITLGRTSLNVVVEGEIRLE